MAQSIDPSKVLGYEFPPQKVSYNRRDLILYSLGIGAVEQRFLYEGDENFGAFPTYPVVLNLKGDSSDIATFGGNFGSIPGFNINPMMILHGEQAIEQLAPLPDSGDFLLKAKVVGLYDKGKGAVMVTASDMVDARGKVYCRLTSSIFVRGAGGFGGDRGPSNNNTYAAPQRAPDAVEEYTTTPTQALLYRLSGDYNPLHADPNMAAMVGFERPILHGLCFYGVAARAALKHFGGNDPASMKSFSVRFTGSVLPGETVVTEMWKEGNDIIIRQRLKERDVVTISNACMKINPAGGASAGAPTSDLKSAAIFDAMKAAIAARPDILRKVNAVYQFNITKAGNTTSFLVDLKNAPGSVQSPAPSSPSPDCTITISDDDYFDMSSGKLNPQQAFLGGKLKVKGNMMLAQKLGLLQEAASKL